MAGLPKPWVMSEKCVRCLWMLGSKIICGRVLHRGERSWLSRSINSLVICLQKEKKTAFKRRFSQENFTAAQNQCTSCALHLFVYMLLCVFNCMQEIYRFAGRGIQCAHDLCLHYIAVVFIVSRHTIIYLFIFVRILSAVCLFICGVLWCVIIIILRLQ